MRAISDLESPQFGPEVHEREENRYYTTEAKLERIADEIGVGPEHYEELERMLEQDEVSALAVGNEELSERPRWFGRAHKLIEEDEVREVELHDDQVIDQDLREPEWQGYPLDDGMSIGD